MHERELRAFVAIVEAGRMDHAASSLGYSQPAISYQIKCLEQQLGTRLFTRHPDGAQLTPEGALVLPSARAVLTLLDGIKSMIGRPRRLTATTAIAAAKTGAATPAIPAIPAIPAATPAATAAAAVAELRAAG